jgi:hypothetical protein
VEDVQRMSHNSTLSHCHAADRSTNRLRGRHAAAVASISSLGFGRSVLCYRPFAACDTSAVNALLYACKRLWLCYSSPLVPRKVWWSDYERGGRCEPL